MIKSEDASDPSVKKILLIAEKLGWRSIEIIPGNTILGRLHGTTPKGETVVPLPDWLDSMDACMELVELMRKYFFSIQLFGRDYTEEWDVVCIPRSGHDEKIPNLIARGKNLPDAICNTFLAWKGVLIK